MAGCLTSLNFEVRQAYVAKGGRGLIHRQCAAVGPGGVERADIDGIADAKHAVGYFDNTDADLGELMSNLADKLFHGYHPAFCLKIILFA